jgi:hypothetical protein
MRIVNADLDLVIVMDVCLSLKCFWFNFMSMESNERLEQATRKVIKFIFLQAVALMTGRI